ncbi:MAG: EAL domain-containing protein [Granulosicoccus sp.]|nr:EAL domain-containing protein [Granulosicoccus sp.]
MDTLLIDRVWLFLATILVLSMQAGFLLLEAGRVRSKNTISVAQKNISDLTVSWAAFFLVGYWLMYGHGVPATDLSGDERSNDILRFLYQLGFCATAASIVSGAVAERMKFVAYLILAGVTASLIYPLAGRWVWSDLSGSGGAWLAQIGFYDFAGATVVHGVGGSVALAAVLIIGPRHGRFDEKGQVRPISGHNSVLSLQGVLILFVGWFGFNGGSVSPADHQFASVMLATASAGCFGALAGIISGSWLDQGIYNPSRISSGLLGGLVAITASVNLVSVAEAGVIGLLGGLIATLGSELLLRRCKIDDPIDAIATHGLAGLFGTLVVAFVSMPTALPTGGRAEQFVVQAIGAAAIFTMAFSVAFFTLKLLSMLMSVKVSAEQQKLGLNTTEHGEAIGTDRVTRALEDQLFEKSSPLSSFEIEGDGETEELAAAMNQLLDRHEQARQIIAESQIRFEQFARTASDWLWETDASLKFRYLSVESDIVAQSDLVRMKNQYLHGLLKWDENEFDSVNELIEKRLPFDSHDAELLLPNGDRRLVDVRGIPFQENEIFAGYRGTFQDVTERRNAEKRAIYLSHHDALTGLANRRALVMDLEKTLSREPAAIAAVDLDGFKAVNDTYGHSVGDQLLLEVAKRLRASVAKFGSVYRTGGDEFVLVLRRDANIPNQKTLVDGCEKLIARLSLPFHDKERELRLGASVGVSLAPEHSRDADELMHLADLALYKAKSEGKGCVRVFETYMDNDAQHKVAMETALRTALYNNEFELHYQPQYNNDAKTIKGFEALLRWNNDQLGSVPPRTFIPMAERLGLMVPIGDFVLRSACQFAATWPASDRRSALTIAVNISSVQFNQSDIASKVSQMLDETGLAPERLELEIQKDILIENLPSVVRTLSTLRSFGVSVAIDNFGVDYSSLRHLKELPIDRLKIDRYFVRTLEDSKRSREVTHSIIMLAHKLGYVVTAEGVERKQQSDILKSWNCDTMQGYLFAQPMNTSQVMDMLQRIPDDYDNLRSDAA